MVIVIFCVSETFLSSVPFLTTKIPFATDKPVSSTLSPVISCHVVPPSILYFIAESTPVNLPQSGPFAVNTASGFSTYESPSLLSVRHPCESVEIIYAGSSDIKYFTSAESSVIGTGYSVDTTVTPIFAPSVRSLADNLFLSTI